MSRAMGDAARCGAERCGARARVRCSAARRGARESALRSDGTVPHASEHSCGTRAARGLRAARAAPTSADLYDMAQSQGVTCLTVSFVGEDARNAAIVSAPPSGEPGGSVRWTYSSRMMRAASSSKPRRTWT